ncbi:AraC family transcriptional regulator [bacterium 1XD42-54]|nr:AraC family transcriptional regulator [bacterium 1XD42-54]
MHLTRIQKRKELLPSTPLSITEIAELTGYASSATLLRAFKRYEGVTPGWLPETSHFINENYLIKRSYAIYRTSLNRYIDLRSAISAILAAFRRVSPCTRL